ncbi:MAG: hypothetical protein ACU837_02450 [Gammaproteobacteria bacterium]
MELLKEYLALCFFKNNPLDLHPTPRFIWKNLLFYLGMGILVEANISDFVDGAIEIVVEVLITVFLIFTLLLFTKRLYLFIQLLTALIVSENFILFLGVITEILDVIAQQTQFAVVTIILGVDLVLWYIAIVAYILRQIFAFTTLKSFSLATFYCVFTVVGAFLFTEVL